MTRKEKVDLVLSKVAEDRKEDFIADFRKAGSKEERKAVLKKHKNISLFLKNAYKNNLIYP